MRKDETPTLDELNDIHRQWMALDSTGPKAEIDRVCKLMKRCPAVNISVSKDGKTGIVMVDGTPISAHPWPVEQCKNWLRSYAASSFKTVRMDVAWCGGEGKWVAL